MKDKIIIKNGFLVDPKSSRQGYFDIVIIDDKICEVIQKDNKYNCISSYDCARVIDASGMTIVPGLIDVHCHLRDPGLEYKEDLLSGSMSAAKGGFTSVACMPNTKPVADNKTVIEYIKNKAKRIGLVNVYPIGAISKGLEGLELAEIGELKEAGAVAISDDGNPVSNSSLMKKALLYSSYFDMPVISHCEDLSLAEEGVMNEGRMSTMLGLKGIPSAAEEVMVARDIILSEYTGVPVHIAHVSTRLSVELIRKAKQRGVKVTAETCPHYFSITDEACDNFNTNAKANPPLRTQDDIEAIIEGLSDGTIDIIATDHAPHHIDEKNVEFNMALNGISGFETAVGLCITNLIKSQRMDLADLICKMSVNPASLLKLSRKGCLDAGYDADVTIIDLNSEYRVDSSKFYSKGKNTPFNNFLLYGDVKYTIVGGKIIVDGGNVICSQTN